MEPCHVFDMQIISVISQKGGSGKTTIALNLAIAAANAGKQVLVIDIDPQQSAVRWARLRKADIPVIIGAHAPNLIEHIEKARSAGADLVLIDTAPKSESASLIAAKAADLLLIPCRPSNLDLDAVADSVNIARLAAKPAVFVINGCQAASSLGDGAAEALAEYDLPIASTRIGQRVAFVKSLANGLGVTEFDSRGSAAKEIKALYTYTRNQGDM